MTDWPAKRTAPPPPLPPWISEHEPCPDRRLEQEYQKAADTFLREHPECVPEFWERVIGIDLAATDASGKRLWDFTGSPIEGYVQAWLSRKDEDQ